MLYASINAVIAPPFVHNNVIRKTTLSRIETRHVRIRLVALPRRGELDEFDFRQYRVGEVYDLPPNFASVLLISGCAEPVASPQERATAADSHLRKGRKPPKQTH